MAILINFVATKLADYVVSQDSAADHEVLVFGFTLFIQENIFPVIIALIAIPFGVFGEMLLTLALFISFRKLTGGAHANSQFICILSCFVIQYGCIALARFLVIPTLVLVICFLLSAILILRYVPADTDQLPFTGNAKTRKIITLSVLIVCLVASLLLGKYLSVYARLLVIVPTVICLMTHPLVYKLYGCRHSADSEAI